MKMTSKGSRMVVFQILIVLIMSSAALAGNTYYVSKQTGSDSNLGTQSNPWLTIQHAAGEVNAGDTIVVVAGTYSERVRTEVAGTSESNRVTFLASGTVIMQGFEVNHDYVTIDGFEITNTGVGNSGVWIGSYVEYCKIFNSTIHDLPEGAFGIRMYFVRTESDYDDPAYPSYATIQGNTIYRICQMGMDIHGRYHTIENNEIYYVQSCGGDCDGIRFKGHDLVFKGNYIHDMRASNGCNGHVDAFQSWTKSGATNPSSGFYNITIEGNWIENIEHDWIMFNWEQNAAGLNYNVVIKNNVLKVGTHVLHGGHIHGVHHLYVYNNTFVDTGTEVSFRTLYDGGKGRYQYVKNNIYYGPSHYIEPGARAEVSNNLVYPANKNGDFQVGDGINGQDPNFVDYNDKDYHLQSGSPAIDAGASIASVSTDKNGVSRPQGSGWDIGAYEGVGVLGPSDGVTVSTYIEAESGSLSYPMEVGNSADPVPTGGRYIYATSGSGDTINPAAEAVYNINIPEAGNYYLWIRLYAPSTNNDAVYAGFNGNFNRVYPTQVERYEWVNVETANLSAGMHQITIGHGEELTRVDLIYVTNAPVAKPMTLFIVQ